MIQKVIVLGGGTAGLLAALSLRVRLPQLTVQVIRSRELGVIGVGEGSTVGLPSYLHGLLQIDPSAFFRHAAPTWKLGLRFVEWGPRSQFHYSFAPTMQARWPGLAKLTGFYCDADPSGAGVAAALMDEDRVFIRRPDGSPLMQRDYGYHLENAQFVEMLERCAAERGIELLDDKVTSVRRNDAGVTALELASGSTVTADLFVDCSGFASLLLGQTMREPFQSFRSTLFCDRAVVGGWARGEEVIRPYTTVQTMSAGWGWQIDHEARINRGYVYASAFLSDEEAEREFRAQNPRVEVTRIVHFKTGRYARAWSGNVVAIGNACGFVEPLEATSLGAICAESALLFEVLEDANGTPTPSQVRYFNERVGESWDNIRRFLAIHYKFNTRLDTPFWRTCRAETELAGAEPILEFYQENGPTDLAKQSLLSRYDQFTIDGWLTLLVGMQVPHRRPHSPTPAEARVWAEVRAKLREKARQAFTVHEALTLVRSPRWRWNLESFKLG